MLGATRSEVGIPSALSHDYAAPELVSAESVLLEDELLELLEDWFSLDPGALDVLATGFDSGDQEMATARPLEVKRLQYAPSVDSFIARVSFDIGYVFTSRDGDAGPADTVDIFDLWIDLTANRSEVLDVILTVQAVFPD